MKFTPHAYQQTATRFLIQHPEAALLLDMGLGKTACTLLAFLMLQRKGAAHKALVIAPLRVAELVWRQEAAKWDQFSALRVAVLHGDGKDDWQKDADIYVINHDGLPWLCGRINPKKTRTRLDALIDRGVDTLVLDELSKFKHTKTGRFETLKPYLPKFSRRWGLTGSPAPNGLLDLFGQCYALDLGQRLGRYITHYRYQYFIPCGLQGREWRPQPGASERIFDKIKDLALSMKAADHLQGLPELVEQNMWVDLPAKARAFYDELEREMIAELDGEKVTVNSAAALSGKCRQAASGGVYVLRKDGLPVTVGSCVRESLHVHDAKTEALMEMIDELQEQPLLVAYEFQHDVERILAVRPKTPVIGGGTTSKQAAALVEQWNRGELPVLLGHPASMGHGLNLQGAGCGHVCWYTMTWDLELYQQLIARVWRQGAKAERVVVHRILTRDTVD